LKHVFKCLRERRGAHLKTLREGLKTRPGIACGGEKTGLFKSRKSTLKSGQYSVIKVKKKKRAVTGRYGKKFKGGAGTRHAQLECQQARSGVVHQAQRMGEGEKKKYWNRLKTYPC